MKKEEILKIFCLNMLKGGVGRMSHIQRLIKDLRPDICGLLEAVGDKKRIIFFEKFAKKNGYKFYFAKANSKYNICVFSKLELSVKLIKKNIRHVAVQGKILEKNFKETKVIFVHLSPKTEDDRLKEIQEILSTKEIKNKTIIMGDLNSLSIQDGYNENILIKNLIKHSIHKFGDINIRFDVINKVIKNGFVDAVFYKKKKPVYTVPTSSNKDYTHAVKIRIDYAFVTKDLVKKIITAYVVKNRHSEKASDHYPLFLELKK